MPDIFYFFLMLVSGVFVALQPLINASLATRIGLVESAFVSFAVGTVTLGVVVVAYNHGDFKAMAGAPWWQFTGGILGAFFVTTIIMAVPRIGTMAALAAAIASQLVAGALFDKFGIMGGRTIPLDSWRVAGMLLLFIGAALVMKG